MNFMVYDLILLGIFIIFISVFLYKKRKTVKKEGLLLLYRTSWGVKLINKIGNKYKKLIKKLGYVSVGLGYLLMAGMIYLAGRIVWIYAFRPDIIRAIKVPPILPLVPYLPQVFKLDFLPPFYFTYWIVIIAIIAITHEFAHGIFAAKDKVKIKTTGFGFFPFFLPIFLAAFVELDEKKMAKKKKFNQLSILSAGTFANVLTAILFFIILIIFFSFAFAPKGIIFDNYAYSAVEVKDISMMNGISLYNPSYNQILDLANETGLSVIKVGDESYMATKELLEQQENNEGGIVLYYDAPAVNANLSTIILKINEEQITGLDKLRDEILKYSPGEEITVNILNAEGEEQSVDIILGEHPEDKNLPWMGIGFSEQNTQGILGKIYTSLSSFKKPHVYYQPKIDGVSIFIYNLLLWIIIISISVALINMLPVGIFDGGRFFYLTVLGITKKEKLSKNIFAFVTYLFLFLLILLMVLWVISFR